MRMDRHDILRSWIYVPGHRQRMIDKAPSLGADVIMLELEDGVPPSEKDVARSQVAAALDARAASGEGAPLFFVRVSVPDADGFMSDLDAAIRKGCAGIVLPKVEDPNEIRRAETQISALEAMRGLAPDSIKFLASIESPAALFKAAEIGAASKRNMGLTLGIEDFARAFGLPLKREAEALDLTYPRAHIALVAASMGLQAVDGIWPRLDDAEGMARFALQGRRLGMTGMALLHPAQITPCHAAFGPSPEEIAYAEEVLKAYAEAEAGGQSAVSFRGQFLDAPVVDRARRTVALAKG